MNGDHTWLIYPVTVLSGLLLWSFVVATVRDPGYIRSSHPVASARECARCMQSKPIRAYHCRKCDKCVFRMDHHCVWIGNCVGYSNQKPFILFLLYCLILSSISSLIQAIAFCRWLIFRSVSPDWILGECLLFLINVFTLLIVRGYFSDQLEALESNTTLIETYKDVRGEADIDVFRQIFGNNFLLWFVPVNSTDAPNYAEQTIPGPSRSDTPMELVDMPSRKKFS